MVKKIIIVMLVIFLGSLILFYPFFVRSNGAASCNCTGLCPKDVCKWYKESYFDKIINKQK